MKEETKKSRFVGLRMTPAQEKLLSRLMEAHGYKTQTDVLLNGLESLAARSFLSPATRPPQGAALQEPEEVMRKVVATISKIDEIVDKYHKDESYLIQILLEIQREHNWLPREALLWLSERLGVSLNRIYQIATFYKAFSLIPRGRHLVMVCTGTACHVRGSMTLVERAARVLGIKAGETTKDMRFSMETVNCLGCCALGPVIVVNQEYYSNPSTAEIEKIFNACP